MKLKVPHKLLIFIGTVILLNLNFPLPSVPRKFNVREGEIASTEVIAPYDFSIPKNKDELIEEREEIARRVPPIFELDNTVYKTVSKKIVAFEHTIDSLGKLNLNKDSLAHLIQREYAFDYRVILYLLKNNYKLIFKKINKGLGDLYAEGIVDAESPEFRIITILSGDKEMVESIDQLYSVAKAESILSRGQRSEYRNLVGFFLRPNVTFNKQKTEERLNEVFTNVPKTKGNILKDELIVEKHKRITKETMEKIIALEKTYISIGSWQTLKTIIFRNLLYLAIIFLLYRFNKITKSNIFASKNLYFIALLSALYLIIGRITYATDTIYLLPIAFFVFMFALYFNFYTALIFTAIFASVFGLVLNSLATFVYLFVGSIVATFSIQSINSRVSLYRPMMYVILANVATILFIDVYLLKGPVIFVHFGEGILSGILASVSLALVLPLFEKLFDFATDLTLLELGNLNLAIFKSMAMESAGSYHHSIVVGNLAEAGANAIGADPILARVGAYYHDIGKLKKPEYFIENQVGVKNPHDSLKPQMSALVIISHVKEGIEMAKKMKLPKKLIDIIEQHHGTTTIETFYKKALNVSADINQDSFRYPGPKPKTKESALVMLADSVEATARSERKITVSKMQKIVKENIEKKFNDGQLDDCPITRNDLQQIRTVFLPILTGVFHPRLDYEQPPR